MPWVGGGCGRWAAGWRGFCQGAWRGHQGGWAEPKSCGNEVIRMGYFPMNTLDVPQTGWRLRAALVLVWITPAFWTVNYYVARKAPGEIEPHMLALLRWSLVGLALLFMVGREIRQRWPLTREEVVDALIMGALGMWICGAFVYLGGQTTSAVNIGLLYALSPVMIAAVSVWALKEPFSVRQAFGVAMALLGMVWIVSQGQPERISPDTFSVGDIWILAAAISWTVYSIRLKARKSRFSSMGRLLVMTLGGVLILLPMTALEAMLLDEWNLTGQGAWLGVLAAVFPGLLAYLSYSFMQRELGAAKTAMVLYLGPLYTAVMSWLLLNEPPQMFHLVGGIAILLGIYLVTASRVALPSRSSAQSPTRLP